jgi:demethylmenaquinone methyltransferase/2-methoxy-6-polyprenyl-1,4-benzoquinol methylase
VSDTPDQRNGPEVTHFGFEKVPAPEKARRVAQVFHSVARRYDLMNDLMSMGVHRLWKRFTVELARVRPGQRVLDLAGGTGDLARAFARRVGPRGRVVLSDINASMLEVGRERLTDEGVVGNLDYVQANAERLPFRSNHFHVVTIGFGLRNVTHKEAALREMLRVLRPGGQALVLEFSQPNRWIAPAYDVYSFEILPRLGRWVARDEASYRYLAESIRVHPDQETLEAMMREAGFARCTYHNLTGGVVAVHRGYKV